MVLTYVDMIRDPIHGYIYLTEIEESIVNTPIFQRLRLIKQTPGASWVYPGANHTRFEHSLGVMHLTGELVSNLLHRDESLKKLPEEQKKKLLQNVRLAGLLHDIGHGPFSHVFEEYLNYVNSEITHEDIGELILREYFKNGILADYDGLEQVINWLREREYGVGSVVVQSISTDALDYLVRDAYHTGAIEYGYVDVKRIIDNTVLVHLSDDERDELDSNGIVTLKGSESDECENMIIAIDERAIIAVESFFLSRLQMFKAVYYHRTVRAIENGLIKCMLEIKDRIPILNLFNGLKETDLGEKLKHQFSEFIKLNDYYMIAKFLEEGCKYFDKILQRKQFRRVYERVDTASSYEFGTYARRRSRRGKIERGIKEELRNSTGEAIDIILDVPFPLIPVKVERTYIKYREGGKDKIATLSHYILYSTKREAPVLRSIVSQNALYMIEEKVFADTEDENLLSITEKIAKNVLGRGGPTPHM